MMFDAVVRHEGGILSMKTFRDIIGPAAEIDEGQGRSPAGSEPENLFANVESLPTLKEVSQMLVEECLRRADGNQSVAAGMLGMTRTALNKRLKRSG